MPLYRDEGVVLRTAKLGEADRIVTLLTRSHGKVRAVAKGARRVRSRFGARLEPFMRVDALIATGRSLDTISQAQSLAMYAAPITADYDTYMAANIVTETIDKLVTAEREPVGAQYGLLLGALHALARGAHRPDAVACSYVMRALALAGWSPRLDSCVVCGRAAGGDAAGDDSDRDRDADRAAPLYCSLAAGGVMCQADRTPEARRIEPATLRQFAALVRGEWSVLDGEPLDESTRRLVEEWSEYYMERQIRSLRLLD